MKTKRSKRDQQNSDIIQSVALSPRPLSAITSIGSPEPNITETAKDSTLPETNSAIDSSQPNNALLPSTSRCQLNRTSEVQPIIHQSFSSKINTTQSFKRCTFQQNQIHPEQSIDVLNSFNQTPTDNPSRNSNILPTPDQPLFRRIQRPICQTTYRKIQVREKSDSRARRRRLCPCCSPCCCLALSIIVALVIAGLAGLIAVFSIPHTTAKTSDSSLLTTTNTTKSTSTLSTTSLATTVSSNPCTSTWSNMTTISVCTNCPDIDPYQQYSYTFVAISNMTRITFAFREDIGYFALDTISVRAISAPSIELVANGGFETGNFSSWIYCNPSGSSFPGRIKQNSENFSFKGRTYRASNGSYFYLDGAVANADYLSQTLSTTISETYNISFWIYNQGNGINNFANVIFST